MGGVGDFFVRAATDVATFGTAEIANAATGGAIYGGNGKSGILKPSSWFNGGGGGGGQPGPANPPGIGPTMGQADPSGIPLLAQIALGTPVDDALGAIYGQQPGSDFGTWSKQLSPSDLQQITALRSSLTNVQNDVNARKTLMTGIIQQYPQIASLQLQQHMDLAGANADIGGQIDEIDKQVLNHAADQLSAKFAASGGFSSGAFNQALNQTGVDLAVNKNQQLMDYAGGVRDIVNQGTIANWQAQNKQKLGAWQAQYNEALAARNYQNNMLTKGVDSIFSANQDALNRVTQLAGKNIDQAGATGRQKQKQRFGIDTALGKVGGGLIGGAIGGPPGAVIGGELGGDLGGWGGSA